MTTPIKFGTDGWRAIIAEDYTFDNVRLCAQALCRYLHDTGNTDRGLVIGYDTRFGSEHFAAATAEVAAANGIRVFLSSKACPTPVASHAIRDLQANAGVVITASHNPGTYNGFKIKDERSSSAAQEVVDQIEGLIGTLAPGAVKRMPLDEAKRRGMVELINPDGPYLATVRGLLTEERIAGLQDAGMHVVVDSMYGAGIGYTRRLLSGGRTKLTELNRVRNPAFPGMQQPEPITQNLRKLQRRVQQGAQVGLATDGDADRLGVVDEHGNFVTQLQVYALLALYLLEVRKLRGPLIKTITTTSMIYRLGERYNVPVTETDVGFKYVGPQMIEQDALMGGEESGGYGFRGHIPERDGILAGLYFLDLMVATGRTPSQLIEHLYSLVGPHYYDRVDCHYPQEERDRIIGRVGEGRQELKGARVAQQERFGGENGTSLNGVRFTLEDGSWLLVRFSGTEPLLRIYAETSSKEEVEHMLAAGRAMAGV